MLESAKCYRCERILPLRAFGIDNNNRPFRYCRGCFRHFSRENYKKNREIKILRQLEYNKRRRNAEALKKEIAKENLHRDLNWRIDN